MKSSLLILVACLLFPCCSRTEEPDPMAGLAKALSENNLDAVRTAVATGLATLGEKAGEPEVADEFRKVPAEATLLSREEAQSGFTRHFATLEKMNWWKIGVDPTQITAPLRAPAAIITGNVAAVRGKLDGADQSLMLAKNAAAFLMWAQEQAGSGVYPFPAARGTSNARAMQVATRFLETAEKAGKMDTIVRNGWAFDDAGDGGLQFDNGQCGAALLDLFGVTKDDRYLASVRKAADWAAAVPLCPNWNYNSFSVFLLAKTYRITNEEKYLNAAVHKTLLGIIPGQLTKGPYAGRWMDPHNARPAYHYIMMRALVELVAVMPVHHVDRPEILQALTLGLKTRNAEIVSKGVMTKDHSLESLLLVNHVFKNDPAFLRDTQSTAALEAIGRLVSEESRRGKQPLGPGSWGLFLEFIVSQPPSGI